MRVAEVEQGAPRSRRRAVAHIIELTGAQLALTPASSTGAEALWDDHTAIANLERALGRR